MSGNARSDLRVEQPLDIARAVLFQPRDKAIVPLQYQATLAIALRQLGEDSLPQAAAGTGSRRDTALDIDLLGQRADLHARRIVDNVTTVEADAAPCPLRVTRCGENDNRVADEDALATRIRNAAVDDAAGEEIEDGGVGGIDAIAEQHAERHLRDA